MQREEMMKKNFLMITVIVLLAVGTAGCGQIQWGAAAAQAAPTQEVPLVVDSGFVIAEGIAVPRDYVRLFTRTGGEVDAVLVQKGDLVEAGALLVRFADREQAEAALAAARLQESAAQQDLQRLKENASTVTAAANKEVQNSFIALTEAQQILADLDTDRYETDLDNAKTDVTKARDELDDAQEEWDKNKNLGEENTTRKNAKKKLEDSQKKYDDAVRKRDRQINKMDQARADVELVQARYDSAVLEWEKCKNGTPKQEDLDLAESQLASAKAQVAAAQRALANLELRAPFTGTVIELDIAPGEIILPNQQVVLLADMSSWYVETTDLSELDVVKISEGQSASISPDALPDLALSAVVEDIARSAGRKGGDVIYTARLRLDESNPLLRWGMTVEIRFAK
jgi:multidrug resistance efflux pump